MANNVFISFRFRDGNRYKEELATLFDESIDTVDCSEDQNRSYMSDYTIQRFLYGKLQRSSVTILILTPESVNHHKDYWVGKYDDWIYDELRYSLEDREGNRTNGLIAVYTPEAEQMVCHRTTDGTTWISDFDNLARKNMLNVKPEYKKCKDDGLYDRDYDSYCSLISYADFKRKYEHYIELAVWKKEHRSHYNIVKRM